jgi:hypothetical protein
MTLEQADEQALRAAEKDDVPGIEQALAHRAQAILELRGQPPSVELADRLRAAIEAGDQLRAALLAIKYRAGLQNSRLEQLKAGLAAGFATRRRLGIDCRG